MRKFFFLWGVLWGANHLTGCSTVGKTALEMGAEVVAEEICEPQNVYCDERLENRERLPQ